MVRIIGGANGTGKTQKLIDMANKENETAKGLQVYIDSSLNHSRQVITQIRFIDASEFHIESSEMFFGFLCGLIAGNYDIEEIYIDDILEILQSDTVETAIAFLDQLAVFTDEFQCNITLSLGTTNPEEIALLKSKFEYME